MSSVIVTAADGAKAEFAAPITVDVAAAPEPEPGPWAFKGIFCRDDEFAQCYPADFKTMGLSVMECYQGSGTTNLRKRMDQVKEPDMAWSLLGSYTANSSGGSFSISDANLRTIIQSVRDHPRNSHFYYIADEPNLTNMTTQQQDACRSKLRARTALIHEEDPHPETTVALGDYRQAQLDPAMSLRAEGMWRGVVDVVCLDGYPTPSIDADPQRIPDQAKWCDAAGMRYVAVMSIHEFQGNNPSYPTKEQVGKANDAWHRTRAEGLIIYIYYDAEGTKHLRDDPAMKEYVGTLD